MTIQLSVQSWVRRTRRSRHVAASSFVPVICGGRFAVPNKERNLWNCLVASETVTSLCTKTFKMEKNLNALGSISGTAGGGAPSRSVHFHRWHEGSPLPANAS